MTFQDALSAIFDDAEQIRRPSWPSKSHVSLEEGLLCIWGQYVDGKWVDTGKWHPWTLTESDYFSDDWEIV